MSFDLTNKNISDTYQNLLQKTGSNNQLFDLLGNPVKDITIQGALIAESYIVSQSTTVFSSGSTAFGNSSDDTHNFIGSMNTTGAITASGNISASGLIIAKNGATSNEKLLTITEDGNERFAVDEDGDVTLDGDLTAGGNVISSNGIFKGPDADSSIQILDSGIFIRSNPSDGLDTQTVAKFLNTGVNIGSTEGAPVTIDTNLTASKNISGSSTSTLSMGGQATFGSHITASGNISSSGTLIGNTLTLNGLSDATETTALMINSSKVVSTRELGSNAFTSTTIGTTTNALTAGDGISSGGTFDGAASRTFSVDLSGLSSVAIGAGTSEVTIGDNLTVAGNLIVQGDTVQQQIANLNVEDRFILLNSGSASGDGGIVVQTEALSGDGVAFGYDDNISRWGFQQGTKLNATGSAIAPDAYASAVVTSDDSNYRKNGNIRVEGGEIYIYVE